MKKRVSPVGIRLSMSYLPIVSLSLLFQIKNLRSTSSAAFQDLPLLTMYWQLYEAIYATLLFEALDGALEFWMKYWMIRWMEHCVEYGWRVEWVTRRRVVMARIIPKQMQSKLSKCLEYWA